MSGITILHYELLDKLGAGGMGEVFKAHDKRLNRFVAIKVLSAARSGAPQRRRRFLQEAQSASALNHPSIITIHDILDEGETQYLVMEYVSGKTLHASIPATGLRISQVLQYSTQMADALSVAHAAGIVHRDFKPANVMITPSGLVKILDFGLAKLTERSDPLSSASNAGSNTGVRFDFGDQPTLAQAPLTTEGSILGTVNYMSPEQAEGKQVDARSDIFSFGAVLYEMVTGQRAFEGDSDISTLTAVLRDDVKPVAEMIPDVPAELDHVIKVCLTKDPDARWQSMREVEMALSGLKRRSDAGVLHKRPGSPPSTPPGSAVQSPISHLPPPAPKSNKRIGLAIAAVAGFIILAGAAAAGWWWTKHRTVAPSPAAIAQAPEVSKPSAISSQPAPTPVPPPSAPETPAPSASVPTQAPSPYATPPRATPSPVPPVIAPPAAPAATPAVTPATAPVPAPAVPRAPGRTVPIDVADGLPFRIALAEDVPANAEEEKALSFRVMEPLKVGDTVLVPRGAVVTGSIASEGGKRFLGLGAKMTFQLDSVDAVDGQKLKVRAAPARKPSGPTTRPIDTGKYAKAKDLAAARGTDYIAYVDGNQTISVRK